MRLRAVSVVMLVVGGFGLRAGAEVANSGTTAAGDQIKLTAIPPPENVDGPPADAKRTASGLATLVLQPGTGKDSPKKDDTVVVHFTAWASDGRMFDSSVARGRPARLFVDTTIKGLSETLQLMVPGEKRRAWVPEALGFLPQSSAPKGALVFDLELIDIPTLALRQRPSDFKKPPRDAVQTSSGLRYKVLRPGAGTRHPDQESLVTVDFAGWMDDGQLFAGSGWREAPAIFTVNELDQKIPGWAEGVKLMVQGEKARFWIPERLAYHGSKAFEGPLIVDVLLIGIDEHDAPRLWPDRPSRTEGVVRPGNGVTYPVMLMQTRPMYTSTAMRAGIQGVVLIEGVVQPNGTLTDLRLTRSLDAIFGLDEEAFKAARQWRFKPATRDGEPVPVPLTVELTFTLR